MLEVKGIQNGIVLDHIASGNGLKVFDKLQLAKVEYPVVLLMNVESRQLGRKDIIKIENTFDVDLTILGLIDANISVCLIKDGKVIEKQKVVLPKEIKGLIQCKNPGASPTMTIISSRCSSWWGKSPWNTCAATARKSRSTMYSPFPPVRP